jgi:hypothetical protein
MIQGKFVVEESLRKIPELEMITKIQLITDHFVSTQCKYCFSGSLCVLEAGCIKPKDVKPRSFWCPEQ